MAKGRLDQERARAVAAVRRVDEDIAQPAEGGEVGDDASEADLAAVGRIQPDAQRVLDRAFCHLAGAADSPITLAAHPVVHPLGVQECLVVAHPLTIGPCACPRHG